jgi:hypothetical protein
MKYVSRRPPRVRQAESLAKMRGMRVFALRMAQRVGKSKVLIDDFGYLYSIGEAQDILIVAPGGAFRTWPTHVKTEFPDDLLEKTRIFLWESAKAKTKPFLQRLEDFLEYRDGPRVLVMNVEALSSVEGARILCMKFLKQRDSACAIDECFPTGTLVTTPYGYAEIQHLQVGDTVVSTNGIVSVKAILKKSSDTLAIIRLGNGKEIKVTPNHPFFTDVGWICAGNLQGRRLCNEQDAQSITRKPELRMVRESIHADSQNSEWEEYWKILREILLSEMEDESSRSSGNVHGRTYQKDTGYIPEEREKETRHGFSESRGSNEGGPEGKTKTSCQTQRAHLQISWGEWSPSSTAATDFDRGIRFALGYGTCNRIGREASRLSNLLQSRPSESRGEISNRMRWIFSQQSGCTESRQEERNQIAGTWVESVEIEKYNDPIDVFDIELDGNPHFFAGDVLVHNSVTIKNHESACGKFVAENLGPIAKYRRILTGLVAPRSPLDLFNQFRFLNIRILGHATFATFKARYAIVKKLCMLPDGQLRGMLRSAIDLGSATTPSVLQWRMLTVDPTLGKMPPSEMKQYLSNVCDWLARDKVIDALGRFGRRIQTIEVIEGYKNVEELGPKLEPFSYRCQLSDCYDLPQSDYSIREVDFHPEQKKIYDSLRKTAQAELESMDYVTATHVIVRMLRLHQILCGFVMDENAVIHDVPEKKTTALLSLLEDYDGKAIIWTSYRNSVARVVGELGKVYGAAAVCEFHGGNTKEREDEERRFKTDPSARFMVATGAGKYGRDWATADLCVYYSCRNDLDFRSQSEERAKAVGKTRMVSYVDLVVPGTIDERFLYALREKIDMSAIIDNDNWRSWVV